MKNFMTMISVLALSAFVFAGTASAHGKKGMKKKRGQRSMTVVKGEKAKTIYESLVDADVETKDRPKISADIKKVASLRCAKLTNKADTSKVKYRCSLKGTKPGKRFNRGHKRGQRRGQRKGHRRGQRRGQI